MADTPPKDSNGRLINVPVPDPSVLTTKALEREIGGLRELLEVKLSRSEDSLNLVRSIIETRLTGMDVALQLLQATTDKFPARIDEKIQALRVFHDEKISALIDTYTEKFSSIQTQFRERDVRTEQSSKDSKVAVDAALQAAKESVGASQTSSAIAISKNETATLKQMDQLGLLLQTGNKATDDKIDDLKERLTRIEGRGEGMSSTWGLMLGGVSLLVGLIAIGGYLFGSKSTAAQPPTVIYATAPAPAPAPTNGLPVVQAPATVVK